MTHPATSRRRSEARAQRATVVAIVLATMVVHAAVITMVEVRSLGADLLSLSDPDGMETAIVVDWEISCEADAALGAGARLGACTSPFEDARAAVCARDAMAAFERDLQRCRDGEVTVQLVDLDDLDLAPKPLVPDVAPMDDVVAAELIERQVAEKMEEAQKRISRPDPTGQIVEITRPQVEVAPDRARYLSEYDSKVEKQTVARGSTEKMVERPVPRERPPTARSNPIEPVEAAAAEAARAAIEGPGKGPGKEPTSLSMRGPGRATETPLPTKNRPGEKSGQEVATAEGIEAPRGDGARMSRTEPREPPGGTADQAGGGGKPAPNLRPTEDLIERAVGGGSVDHIQDAESGEFTALNSRKWIYATFFNRMKRQVAQNWHPDQVYLRRDPTGNIYGTRDRLTVLRVSLNPNGTLAKVYVSKQSGVDFLDDEAMRAFRQAQPFPNPPSGLVDARSNLITFSFGFHFQIGGDRGRWKVFRYQ